MSSKTRTRKISSTTGPTGSARTLQSVPDQAAAAATDRTDAEDKLWEALHTIPNSTAADLSLAAKIGKSTAQKILAKWADDGSVARVTGIAKGGRRAADLWAIIAADTPQSDPAPEDPAAADDDVTGMAEAESDALALPVPGEDTTVDEDNSNLLVNAQPIDADPVDAESVDVVSAIAQIEGTPETDDDVTSAVETGPVITDTATADDAAPDHDHAAIRSDAVTAGEKKAKLPSGALRGMVEDFLTDHAGEEFGPSAIAKALGGKSSGAVSNALDKLVDDGTAVKSSEKPRRFALASAQQAAVAAPTN
ncbi:hypothetical protein PV646_40885 [Streptomyces sp. ID05-26A]|nr:hypothetical protein [Streptomyces sp. ID05-26A]